MEGLFTLLLFHRASLIPGEENDIILLSLVRSNEEGNIGFLKIANRVCVALSRAKKGFYCIGNLEIMGEKSDLWKKIIHDMRKEGKVIIIDITEVIKYCFDDTVIFSGRPSVRQATSKISGRLYVFVSTSICSVQLLVLSSICKKEH